jgi:biopolymer transport protein TolR
MAKKNHYEDASLSPVAEINITPMVDVMLVLLIIFMVTSPLMMSQLPITLPKASSAPSDNPKEPTVVSIDDAGNYFIDAGDGAGPIGTSPENLQPRLIEIAALDPDQLVFVQGASKIEYGRVVDLIGIVSASGFSKVSLKSTKINGAAGDSGAGLVPVP